MERVMIIGCGGSGKSTLARDLGEKTGLSVIHLDQIWWAPGNWQHITQEEFDVQLAKEIQKSRWIIDGNFNRTIETRLQRADTVIYLDFPAILCLFGWIKRVIRYRGKARPDMGKGCCERIDPEFAAWIVTFNRNYRKEYYKLLAEQKEKTIHIFRNRKQLRKFLDSL